MLEYFKTILEKVSFDEELFRKELKKALSQLDADESVKLRQWVAQNYKEHAFDQNTVNNGIISNQ